MSQRRTTSTSSPPHSWLIAAVSLILLVRAQHVTGMCADYSVIVGANWPDERSTCDHCKIAFRALHLPPFGSHRMSVSTGTTRSFPSDEIRAKRTRRIHRESVSRSARNTPRCGRDSSAESRAGEITQTMIHRLRLKRAKLRNTLGSRRRNFGVAAPPMVRSIKPVSD